MLNCIIFPKFQRIINNHQPMIDTFISEKTTLFRGKVKWIKAHSASIGGVYFGFTLTR